jgi:hypothetical protein
MIIRLSFLQSYNKATTTMANQVNINYFPHAVLTPLANQRPTAATLGLLQQELTANAISVTSARGNGLLGHYALVVSPAKYLAAAGVAFVTPVNPGNALVIQMPATAHVIAEANRQFTLDQREFAIYSTTEATLKRLVLKAVPSTYTNVLKDKTLGFANVTTLAILTHLKTDYGTISTDDLDRNLVKLHKEWSLANPIEDLFKQVRQCREFAVDDDPITEKQR